MPFKDKLKGLFKRSFIRNVGILAGGTAVSQLVALLALPLLTRIYTPEDFTVLAVYTSILSLMTAIACLRFEIAIPIPKENDSAINLLALSILSVIGITLLTWLGVFFLGDWINKLTNHRLESYLWLVPLGVFISGFYNALQYWMTRERKFPLVAKTRMTQSLSGTATQLGYGYAGVTPFGLLFGQMLNMGAGVFALSIYFFKNYKSLCLVLSIDTLKKTFKEYDRFPKYSTCEALTNSAGIQIPILLIATLTLGAEAGFLMLAMRLLSVPLGLIGGAIAQVYLSEAAEKYHQGQLNSFTRKIILMLVKVSLLPMLTIAIIAPFLAPLIFGEEWQRTGVLMSWMVPWFFMQFITSPVSMSLHITNNQKTAMTLQIIGLILRGGGVWVTAIYFNSWLGEVYAISGFIFYTLYLMVVLFIIGRR